jgi:hypothetical protein
MPISNFTNYEGKQVPRYQVPLFTLYINNVNREVLEPVRQHRKEYAHQVSELSALQKKFSQEKDYESARGIKDAIKHFTQAEKAATFVINYYEKIIMLNHYDFPLELSELLDYEFHTIEGFVE